MKIIYKTLLTLFFVVIIFASHLSIFGIETDRFNNQISNKIKNIHQDIDVELKKIKLVLDPFKLKLNIKTVGSKLKNQNKNIEIENIKTQISIKSLIENKFLIESLEISTKSLDIKGLISFIRSFQNTPELFILEKIVKKGFLIADLKIEFDSDGKIKDNYEINGYIKDTKLNVLKKYDIQKLNLIFKYKNDDLSLSDIVFSLNDLNFLSENVIFKKVKNDFLVKGKISHKKFDIDEKNLNLFVKPFLSDFNLKKLKLSSKNDFSFKISKKFEFSDLKLNSKVSIDEFSIINEFKLNNFFPNIKKKIYFSDHELSIKYNKDNLLIDGEGNILFQDSNDALKYSFNKKNNKLDFRTILKIDNNPLKIDFLNYEKNDNSEALIQIDGLKNEKDNYFIKSLSIDENKNKINIKNLGLNKKLEVTKLGFFDLDYIDIEKQKNLIKFYSKKNKYYLEGPFFNASKLIDDLLFNENNSNFFNIDMRINLNIEKVHLDNEYDLSNFIGNIYFKKKQITKADLVGDFSKNKKFKFTINTTDDNKITTLYLDEARPIVKKYKFIKGFDKGVLDFYSVKKSGESVSQLKIYDFKLKELPLLTKILTLASLQGIADILSGEGIRFDEFQMNFKNKSNLMNIDEIYAIGPAISILMDGYIEKNKLVSLRGTLVPATTINKFIGSLPVLGKILVGSKTGEGVFGVSFKIKGPPKKLETSVNPIKTLTPRFITRTLEKIKKNSEKLKKN